MKKLLLISCIIIGAASASFAQGGGGRAPMAPADQAAALKTSLALTDAQTTKITTILTAQAASRDSLTKASNGDRQAMRTAMQPIQARYTAAIKAVLTPDQATAYDKQMAARMNRGGGGGAGGGG